MSETNIEVGKIYGNIEVLEHVGDFEDNISLYKCKCIGCGTTRNLNNTDILSYKFPNCTCTSKRLYKGQTKGRLLVLKDKFRKEDKKYYYTCQCLGCNWIGDVRADDLEDENSKGTTNKCSCKRAYNVDKSDTERLVKEDLKGKTNGKVTVIGIHHIDKGKHTIWECKCTCGNTFFKTRDKLIVKATGELIRECPKCAKASLSKSKSNSNQEYDLLGQQIGQCIPIEKIPGSNYADRYNRWKCKCLICNNTFIAHSKDLTEKRVIMCPECTNRALQERECNIIIEDKPLIRKMVSFDDSLKKFNNETHIPKFTITD